MERLRAVQRGGLAFAMQCEMHMAVVGGAGQEEGSCCSLSLYLNTKKKEWAGKEDDLNRFCWKNCAAAEMLLLAQIPLLASGVVGK